MESVDEIVILTGEGEKRWGMEEFIKELKDEAGNGEVQITTLDQATVIAKGTATIVLQGRKEEVFWEGMDRWGWPSGMHPRVIRRKASQ